MGARYIIEVKCPQCGFKDNDVNYAPTCGFTTWLCPHCSRIVNLEKYTGISKAEASNIQEIKELIKQETI